MECVSGSVSWIGAKFGRLFTDIPAEWVVGSAEWVAGSAIQLGIFSDFWRSVGGISAEISAENSADPKIA